VKEGIKNGDDDQRGEKEEVSDADADKGGDPPHKEGVHQRHENRGIHVECRDFELNISVWIPRTKVIHRRDEPAEKETQRIEVLIDLITDLYVDLNIRPVAKIRKQGGGGGVASSTNDIIKL